MPRRRLAARSLADVSLAAVSLVALAALISGCASPNAVAESTPPVAPTSQVAPTPTTPPDSAPVRAFDADCERMLTSDQRDAILGPGAITHAEQQSLWEPARTVPVDLDPIGTLGGLACTWFAAEGADLPEGVSNITTVVMPSSAVPPEFAAKYSVALCEPNYDSSNCRLGRVVGDTWVSASAGWQVREAPRELLSSAIDAVASNLESATRPRPAVIAEGVWAIPDCVALTGAIGLEELIGPYRHGYWEGSEQPEEVLLAAAGVVRGCPLVSDSERIDHDTQETYVLMPQVAPGLGWQWEELRAGTGAAPSEIEVPGAVDAFASDWGYGTSKVFATDGTNVVSVYLGDVDLAVRILSRTLAVLSS